MEIKGLIKTTKEIHIYDSLRKYLKRVHKIEKSAQLTRFLLEKFTNLKYPTGYVKIFHKELKDNDVIDKEEKFYEWRSEMCKKNILVCKADLQSLNDKEANFKAAEFKFGKSIEKYIMIALNEQSNVYERLDTKVDIEKFEEIEKKLNNIIEYVLYKNPPNSQKRREIVENNINDFQKMEQVLKEELEEFQAANKKIRHLSIV